MTMTAARTNPQQKYNTDERMRQLVCSRKHKKCSLEEGFVQITDNRWLEPTTPPLRGTPSLGKQGNCGIRSKSESKNSNSYLLRLWIVMLRLAVAFCAAPSR